MSILKDNFDVARVMGVPTWNVSIGHVNSRIGRPFERSIAMKSRATQRYM